MATKTQSKTAASVTQRKLQRVLDQRECYAAIVLEDEVPDDMIGDPSFELRSAERRARLFNDGCIESLRAIVLRVSVQVAELPAARPTATRRRVKGGVN
jgi:hypothetical protein